MHSGATSARTQPRTAQTQRRAIPPDRVAISAHTHKDAPAGRTVADNHSLPLPAACCSERIQAGSPTAEVASSHRSRYLTRARVASSSSPDARLSIVCARGFGICDDCLADLARLDGRPRRPLVDGHVRRALPSAQMGDDRQTGHRPALENCGSRRGALRFRGNAVLPADPRRRPASGRHAGTRWWRCSRSITPCWYSPPFPAAQASFRLNGGCRSVRRAAASPRVPPRRRCRSDWPRSATPAVDQRTILLALTRVRFQGPPSHRVIPHAAAARKQPGHSGRSSDSLESTSRVRGSVRRTGPEPRVGSGMSGTPCVRMHLANLTAARNWLPVERTPPVPPGASRAHARLADLNAGVPVPANWSGRLLRSGRESSARRVRACNPRTRSRQGSSRARRAARPVRGPAGYKRDTQLTAARLPPTLHLRSSLTCCRLYARPNNSAVTPLRRVDRKHGRVPP